LYGVLPIAYRQAMGTAACPALGPVPACYVVLSAYALIAVSASIGARVNTPLFLTGWIPILILALVGSGLEVLGHEACPRAAANIPTCFLSLALAGVLIVVFRYMRR